MITLMYKLLLSLTCMVWALSAKAFSISLELAVIWLSLGSAHQLISMKHAKDWTVWHCIQWTLWLVSAIVPLILLIWHIGALSTKLDLLIDWLDIKYLHLSIFELLYWLDDWVYHRFYQSETLTQSNHLSIIAHTRHETDHVNLAYVTSVLLFYESLFAGINS